MLNSIQIFESWWLKIFFYYVLTCLSLPTRIPASSKCCKVGKRFLTGNEMSRRVKIRHKLMYLMIVRLISLPLSSCPRKTNKQLRDVCDQEPIKWFVYSSLIGWITFDARRNPNGTWIWPWNWFKLFPPSCD